MKLLCPDRSKGPVFWPSVVDLRSSAAQADLVPADLGRKGGDSRWFSVFLRFNLVSAVGVAVQLGLLTGLTRFFGLNYLGATALAVAITVIHNFAWHERFTFYDRVRDRASHTACAIAARFLKFNLLTGMISIGGNLLLMNWLRGRARLPLLAANLLAIAICGIVNYLANDRLVFRVMQNEECKMQN